MKDAVKTGKLENWFRHAGFLHTFEKNGCNANCENDKRFKKIEFLTFSETFHCDIIFAEYIAANQRLEITKPLTAEEIVEIFAKNLRRWWNWILEILIPCPKCFYYSHKFQFHNQLSVCVHLSWYSRYEAKNLCIYYEEKIAKKVKTNKTKQTTIYKFFTVLKNCANNFI